MRPAGLFAGRGLPALSELHPFQRAVDDDSGDAVENRPEQRRAEAAHMKAVDHAGRRIEHGGVEHEEKQPEGEDGDRQREDEQNGPHQRIEQTDEQRRPHRRTKTRDLHAAVEVGHSQQGAGGKQPLEQEFEHGGSPRFSGLRPDAWPVRLPVRCSWPVSWRAGVGGRLRAGSAL